MVPRKRLGRGRTRRQSSQPSRCASCMTLCEFFVLSIHSQIVSVQRSATLSGTWMSRVRVLTRDSFLERQRSEIRCGVVQLQQARVMVRIAMSRCFANKFFVLLDGLKVSRKYQGELLDVTEYQTL